MKVVIAGLGYVGSVTAGCLSYLGHQVCGVDTNEEKIKVLSGGRPPVREPGLDEMVANGVHSGDISATCDIATAIPGAAVVLICVGTPSRADGSLSLDVVREVVRQIGEVLADQDVRLSLPDGRIAIVVRSTMLPGSSTNDVLPSLRDGLGVSEMPEWIGYAVQPEFLREGTAVADFLDPPKTVFGTNNDWVASRLSDLYRPLGGPIYILRIEEAELTKYVDNAFHAVKVAFANEMGRLAEDAGLDPHQVFRPFLSDHKLNLSEKYLRPGPPFGGSCLPKDVRAIVHRARRRNIAAPLLAGVLRSNQAHLDAICEKVVRTDGDRYVVLGLAFKSHTDDLRESAFVHLMEVLLEGGRRVLAYDATLRRNELFGANRATLNAIVERWPNELQIQDTTPVLEPGDTVVLCTDHPNHIAVAVGTNPGQHTVVDLTGRFVRGRLVSSRSAEMVVASEPE